VGKSTQIKEERRPSRGNTSRDKPERGAKVKIVRNRREKTNQIWTETGEAYARRKPNLTIRANHDQNKV